MKDMKTKRLLAALLTLLLALGCMTPALAVKPDGLERIDIDLPQLPAVSKTVADVKGTTRGPAITYNRLDNASFADGGTMMIQSGPLALSDSIKFTAGMELFINFTLVPPEDFDLPNDAIQPGTLNVSLDVPVYLNGTLIEDAEVVYVEGSNQLAVSVPYTVGRYVDVFDVCGLVLPTAGMTVRESLKNVSIRDLTVSMSAWNTLGSNSTAMSPDQTFQAGEKYLFTVSFGDQDVYYDEDAEGNAVMEMRLDGKPVSGEAGILGGVARSSEPTFNLMYTVPEAGDPTPVDPATTGKALTDIYISGVVLPEEGITVYVSLMDSVVKDMTMLSASWCVPPTGEAVMTPMGNTDKFQAGTTYMLTIEIDATDYNVLEEANTVPSTWVVANVYLNGAKVYDGDPSNPAYRASDLTCYATDGGGSKLVFHYRAQAAQAEAGPTKFTDVSSDAWYSGYVDTAAKMGLINGISDTQFAPNGELTVAQAVKLAAVMHQRYTTGAVSLTNGSPWYTTYAAYCRDNGILAPDGSSEGLTYAKVMAEPNRAITRGEYAWLFSRALPEEALAVKNTIPDGSIPDVAGLDKSTRQGIYKLYRAGVVNGNDAKGTFLPASQIKRSEVAAIVVRMMDASTRVNAPQDLGK